MREVVLGTSLARPSTSAHPTEPASRKGVRETTAELFGLGVD